MEQIQNALMRHNRNTPRYTSYPTAPHFREPVDDAEYGTWLGTLDDDQTFSLYLHIPYCRTLCWYCGCNTKATQKYEPVTIYVDYLLKEIDLVSEKLADKKTVRHIHFGGGSPSMLRPEDFTRIMTAVRAKFTVAPDAEIAIEIDPRELTEPKVAAYAKAGVTRVSFGIQDFHIDVQQAVNRRQPFYMVYDAVNLVRTYGIDHINMDLLYGLPHQTDEKMKANINFAHALKPTRLALFGYAHVPWMKKHMRLIDETALPGAGARLSQFETASTQLKSLGYHAVGLDHFVRAEDPMLEALANHKLRRNFQGYTTDASDCLIGLGVSSIGSLPDHYVQNIADTRSYFAALDDDILPVEKGIHLSAEDHLRRSIIEELMCYQAIDLETHCLNRGEDSRQFAPVFEQLAPLEKDGLVEITGTTITIPENARQAVRLVCAAFDAYLTAAPNRHAQVA